jgi:hypothetical protein
MRSFRNRLRKVVLGALPVAALACSSGHAGSVRGAGRLAAAARRARPLGVLTRVAARPHPIPTPSFHPSTAALPMGAPSRWVCALVRARSTGWARPSCTAVQRSPCLTAGQTGTSPAMWITSAQVAGPKVSALPRSTRARSWEPSSRAWHTSRPPRSPRSCAWRASSRSTAPRSHWCARPGGQPATRSATPGRWRASPVRTGARYRGSFMRSTNRVTLRRSGSRTRPRVACARRWVLPPRPCLGPPAALAARAEARGDGSTPGAARDRSRLLHRRRAFAGDRIAGRGHHPPAHGLRAHAGATARRLSRSARTVSALLSRLLGFFIPEDGRGDPG